MSDRDGVPQRFEARETGRSRPPSSTSPDTESSLPHKDSSSFMQRSMEPPITKSTLAALGVERVINNPGFRHDINFDPELRFGLILYGEEERKRQEKEDEFWSLLENQLAQFVTSRESLSRDHQVGDGWCLPALLAAVKEITQTLLPQRDGDLLNEVLRGELLMQQFYRGVMDVEKLGACLAGVLKSNCARMRDESVDEAYRMLSEGSRRNEIGEVVAGLRGFLHVLGAMKLDAANYRLRCLRPSLIEDTVRFEQQFFRDKIAAGELDVSPAKAWYDEYDDVVRTHHNLARNEEHEVWGGTAAFFTGLSRLVMPSTDSTQIPQTFFSDLVSLVKLRSDMLDAVNLEICMQYYTGLDLARARFGLALSNRDDVATTAPRNPGLTCAQRHAETSDARSRARDVHKSFVALVAAPASSSSSRRWEELVKPLSIEILRHTNIPQNVLPQLEAMLSRSLSDARDERRRVVERQFYDHLLMELAKRVKEFKNLSNVGLFSLATAKRGSESALKDWKQSWVGNIATRLADLGVLHWRVWAPLAYLDQVDVTTAV
ncbi:Protein SOK1 [Pleurostoma richardsiae]|uniref:Protein SOK1 n=1 Tax=Pleurostoma richardsiae TaxID=41990 RepID=A0AA38RIL9_9PEZI|nr:Protein SOK1 [Pleurostoma richardsiae]